MNTGRLFRNVMSLFEGAYPGAPPIFCSFWFQTLFTWLTGNAGDGLAAVGSAKKILVGVVGLNGWLVTDSGVDVNWGRTLDGLEESAGLRFDSGVLIGMITSGAVGLLNQNGSFNRVSTSSFFNVDITVDVCTRSGKVVKLLVSLFQRSSMFSYGKITGVLCKRLMPGECEKYRFTVGLTEL